MRYPLFIETKTIGGDGKFGNNAWRYLRWFPFQTMGWHHLVARWTTPPVLLDVCPTRSSPKGLSSGLAAPVSTAHPFLLCPGSVQSLLKRVSLVLSQFFALREIVQQLFVGRL